MKIRNGFVSNSSSSSFVITSKVPFAQFAQDVVNKLGTPIRTIEELNEYYEGNYGYYPKECSDDDIMDTITDMNALLAFYQKVFGANFMSFRKSEYLENVEALSEGRPLYIFEGEFITDDKSYGNDPEELSEEYNNHKRLIEQGGWIFRACIPDDSYALISRLGSNYTIKDGLS